MKLGGLFSGVGGFELAWTQLGHEVAWMCEVDKSARKVLEARFPGVPIYPDVTEIDVDELEPVDVLTGGSPCQGFSVAGARAGLEHGQSRLFHDYVRILDGLVERGLQWALWENVPGVFSIRNPDGERTFEHVVGALVGSADSVRLDGKRKWNTGLAAGAGRAVAWRVLDSRHFGVAQRRRRVFACVAFGDSAADRAGRTLLAVAEGVRGDSASGVQAGQGVAGGVAAGVGGAGWWSGSDVADSLTATSDQQRMPDKQRFQAVIDAPTTIRKVRSSEWVEDQTGSTLAARDYKDSGDLVFESKEEMVDFGRTSDRIRINAETAATLQSGGGGGGAKTGLYMQQYGVRRLTPVECERLQSFPDGWTEPSGSDSARYKAMGNAVTVNVVRWILGRMVEAG